MSHNNDCVIISTTGQFVNLEPLKGCCINSFLQNYDVSSKNFGRELKFKTVFNGQEIEFKIGDNVYQKRGSYLAIDEMLDFSGYGKLQVKYVEIPKKKFKKGMLVNEVPDLVHRPETEVGNLTDEYSMLPPKIRTIMPSKEEHVLPSVKNKIVIPG